MSKALIVAPNIGVKESACHYIQHAFKQNGVLADLFDYRMLSAITSNRIMNEKLLEYCQKEKPPLILLLKGELVEPSTIEEIRKIGVKTAIWYFDLEIPSTLLNLVDKVDHFFLHVPHPEYLEFYRDMGANIHYLPQGVDIRYYKPMKPKEEWACDISFIGSLKPGRAEILRELSRKYDVKVWGNGWSRVSGVKWMGGAIYHEDFCRAVASSKININLGYTPYWDYDLSYRLYQVTACKGFMLCNYVDGLQHLFSLGDETRMYKHDNLYLSLKYPRLFPENWYKIIDDILSESNERMEVALRGFERCVKDHQYKNRIAEMFEVMEVKDG